MQAVGDEEEGEEEEGGHFGLIHVWWIEVCGYGLERWCWCSAECR